MNGERSGLWYGRRREDREVEDDSHGKDVLLLRAGMPESLRSESPQIHENVNTSTPPLFLSALTDENEE